MILCVLPGADRKSCVAVDVDPAGEIVTDLDEKQTSFSIGVQADLPRSIHLFAGGYRIFKGIAQNDRHVIGVDPLFCRIGEIRRERDLPFCCLPAFLMHDDVRDRVPRLTWKIEPADRALDRKSVV